MNIAQQCVTCLFRSDWREPHGEDCAMCEHPEREECFWGEIDSDREDEDCPFRIVRD